jgi:hypothetical protein
VLTTFEENEEEMSLGVATSRRGSRRGSSSSTMCGWKEARSRGEPVDPGQLERVISEGLRAA